MAREIEYDDNGSTFYYFLLSGLALYLIPASIGRWNARQERLAGACASPRQSCPTGLCCAVHPLPHIECCWFVWGPVGCAGFALLTPHVRAHKHTCHTYRANTSQPHSHIHDTHTHMRYHTHTHICVHAPARKYICICTQQLCASGRLRRRRRKTQSVAVQSSSRKRTRMYSEGSPKASLPSGNPAGWG